MRTKRRSAKDVIGILIQMAILLMLSINTGLAQQSKINEGRRTVTGRVIDEDNKKPVTGATVRVKGLPIYTTTDGKGKYSLLAPDDSLAILKFSYRGMKTQEVVLNKRRKVKIALHGIEFSPNSFHILPDFHLNAIKDQDSGLRSLAECHFTVANAANPQNLKLCEKLGLAVMITEGPHLREKDWLQLSDKEIDAKIKRMVDNGGDSKAIIGYYLVDEPHVSSFPALAKAVAAVKKYAPGKLAYINLYPEHGTIMKDGQLKSQLGTNSYTEYLERFVKEVNPQFLCYDNYRVLYSMDLEKMNVGSVYFTNLLEVRRIALKYDLPFFNIVASNQIRPHTTIPSPSNLLLQAYTTIASGASGVQWYTYHYSGGKSKYRYMPLDSKENKTLTWRYLEEVNRQLSVLGPIIKSLKSTGVYFTSPAPAASLPLLPGNWVETVVSNAPMMIGEFISAKNEKYVMVVNLSLERSAKFFLKTKIHNEKVSMISAADEGQLIEMDEITSEDMGATGGYWLVPGQGVFIKCSGSASSDLDLDNLNSNL